MVRHFKALTPYAEYTCRTKRDVRYLGVGLDAAGAVKSVTWAETESAARSAAGRNWRETGVAKVEIFPTQETEKDVSKPEQAAAGPA